MAETTVSVEREAAVSLSAAVLERSESLAIDRRTDVRLVATTAALDGVAVELDVAASGTPEGGTTVVAEARDVGDDDRAVTDEQLGAFEREFVAALESAVDEGSVVRREASTGDGDAARVGTDDRAAVEPDAGADSVGGAAADAAAEWPLDDDGDERDVEDPDADADDDGSGLSVKVLVFLIFLLSIVAAVALVALVIVPA